MTRAEMLRRMSSAELQEWLAYDLIEPLPEPWRQTGLIAASIHNNGFSSGPARQPQDFIPAKPAKVTIPETDEEIAANVAAIANALGARKG